MPYFQQALELNEMPQINDQKGVGISYGGMGDCYGAKEEFDKAEHAYEINRKISTENGDKEGECRMNSMLGKICLDKASRANESDDKLFSRASDYYKVSLAAAVSQKHGGSIAFALAGITEVYVASKNYRPFNYVLEELGKCIADGLCKINSGLSKNFA